MPAPHPGGAIAEAVLAFLRRHPPFDHMEDAALAALAAACRVVYFAPGEVVIAPTTGVADAFYPEFCIKRVKNTASALYNEDS